MPVNLDQYRGEVWAFNSRLHCKNIYNNISIGKFDVLPIASAFPSILLTFSMFLLFSKSFCFSILLWRNIKIMNILVLRIYHVIVLVTYMFHVWLHLILTKRSGDIKQSLVTKSNSSQSFSICHWNFNSISAHNFIKISFLKNYIATQKLDFICLSETSLDSSFSNDDDNLEIPGFDLFKTDHPSKTVTVFVLGCLYLL